MRHLVRYCLLVFVVAGCRDNYNSPVHAPSSGFLVVEGYISNDTAPSRIHLTRSVKLDSAGTVAEPGATVLVEAKSGGTAAVLAEGAAGYYSGNTTVPDASDQYRIHIITKTNKEYLSDYCSPRNTPAIDSVGWTTYPGGIKIDVSTHDPTGQAQNYRWEYVETWKYTSAYYSELIYQYPLFYTRDSAEQIYTCYRSLGSANVIIASTTGLATDKISRFQLADISYLGSNRLSNSYSINVKQRAISPEALNYYQLLAKNTEQLGSIFDAQPSALSGNVHSIADENEPVFGFIECSAKTEQRIFINRDQLPDVGITTGHGSCDLVSDTHTDPAYYGADTLFFQDHRIPVSGIATDTSITGLIYSTQSCVDCRVQGGTTAKPAFWP